MSKLINQPIELIWQADFPTAFYYERLHRIKYILNHWREAGQWWLHESELFVYEISTDYALCELHYLSQEEHWILYRLGNC